MTFAPTRPILSLALGTALLAVGACSPLRGHTGYVVDADLMNSVQPGVDTRQSVQTSLGRPTFTGQWNESEWYYVARSTRNYGYSKPKVADQVTIKIAFDPSGTVSAITRSDETEVASITPSRKVTPTLGRKKSFFEELFGNIGSVGAPGFGSGQGDGRNPDDTP